MVAPEVVVVEGLKVFPYRNHRGTRGVERNREDLIAGNACLLQHFSRGSGQGAHVIGVRLRSEFGIFAFAVQRIVSHGRGKHAAFAIYKRNAHAQSSEINPGNNGHSASPKENQAYKEKASFLVPDNTSRNKPGPEPPEARPTIPVRADSREPSREDATIPPVRSPESGIRTPAAKGRRKTRWE